MEAETVLNFPIAADSNCRSKQGVYWNNAEERELLLIYTKYYQGPYGLECAAFI